MPEAAQGLSAIAIIFLLSLLLPMNIYVGPLLLRPYRIVLLFVFVPLLVRLLTGRAGKVTLPDWLMLGATCWSTLALMVNHSFSEAIEPSGVQFLDFYGAYLVARTCIRSAGDFHRLARVLFLIILCLLPFAFFESVTHRAILMHLMGEPGAITGANPRFGFRRAQAVFAHPIHYGVFAAAGLGVSWYALKHDAGVGGRLLRAMVVGLSTALSLSTGALIAYVMQSIFILWEALTNPSARRWRVFAWGAAACYLAIELLSNRTPFHVLVTYASFNTGSAYNRILIWRFGTDNVWNNPIFGLGLRDWERPGWMVASVDNFWLLLTMQYGLPFIILFGAAVLLVIRRVSREPLVGALERACRAGYLTTIGGLIIAGGTVHYWQMLMAFFMFLFGSGMWIISSRPSVREQTTSRSERRARNRSAAVTGGTS